MANLAISYRFNTNVPSTVGMEFSFTETDAPVSAERRCDRETYNGITPTTRVVVSDTTGALEFIRSHVGNTWPKWSLFYVMPTDGRSDYYKLIPTALPRATKKLDGHDAQLLCQVTPDGQYDARVSL